MKISLQMKTNADVYYNQTFTKYRTDIEVPSRVDGKRRNLARVSDFVSWDEACRVPRHKLTHECKIPPLSIHE